MMHSKLIKITTTTLLIAFAMLISHSTIVLAASTDGPDGKVLSAAELRDCVDTYDKDDYNISRSAGADKFTKFKKDQCYKPNATNAPCTYKQTLVASDSDPKKKQTHIIISCSYTAPVDNGDDDTDPAAGVTDPAFGNTSCTPTKCTFIDSYVNPFIKLLSVVVGIVAVIAIIFGAIQVSTSAGDPQKAANGKNHIRNALIGLVAYALLGVFLNWLIPGGVL
jgi:hypothetical protein